MPVTKRGDISRRGFLGGLTATLAAAVTEQLDPDFLLWRPGAKKIFIPDDVKVVTAHVLPPGEYWYKAKKFTNRQLGDAPRNAKAVMDRETPLAADEFHYFIKDAENRGMTYIGRFREWELSKLITAQDTIKRSWRDGDK